MPVKHPDEWLTIEKEYRTGAVSNCELARRHGISEGAIRKKAKALNWKRDLKAQYHAELRKQIIAKDGAKAVRKKASTKSGRAKPAPSDDKIVVEAAKAAVKVNDKHRKMTEEHAKGIQGIQAQLNKILDMAEDITLTSDDLRFLAQAQRQLSSATVNIINCDRRSFHMDDPGSGEDVPDAVHITFHREKPPIKPN